MKQKGNGAVVRYYEESLPDYLLFYSRGSRGMHYGYWDKGVRSNQQAVVRLNQVVTRKLKLTSKSRVLDAGCGVGGTALWMAKNIGCSVVGISLSPAQIQQAQAYAQRDGGAAKTQFFVRDYTKTQLPARSFDAIAGIESVCHLQDKTPFIQEAYRLLKPGGRLVIADGMVYEKQYSPRDARLLRKWLEGWGVPPLWRPEDHVAALKKAGFTVVEQKDYSQESWPSARLIFALAIAGIPLFWLGRTLKLISETRYQNTVSCYYQYISRRKKLWGHFMITAKKPR